MQDTAVFTADLAAFDGRCPVSLPGLESKLV